MSCRLALLLALIAVQSATGQDQAEPVMRGAGRKNGPADAGMIVPKYRKQWAVIIGINYQHLTGADSAEVPPLGTAEADAQALYDLLIANYGYEPACTRLLKGPAATRDGIRQLFGDKFLADQEQVTSEDSVLVYFAGHGNRREQAQNHEHYVGLLYPADVEIIAGKGVDTISCLRLSELLGDLRDLCAARHKLVILDSCHSGEVFQYDSHRSAGVNRGFRATLFREPAFQAIAAARGSQKAADADATGEHSPVARALLDALTSGPSGSNQTLFTASELFSFIPRRVQEMGIQQDPRGGWISGDGDFYFFPKSLTPSDFAPQELAAWTTEVRSAEPSARSVGLSESSNGSYSTLIVIASLSGLAFIALVGLVGWRRMQVARPKTPIATLLHPATAPSTDAAVPGPLLCLRLVGTPCIYQAAPSASVIRVGRQRRKPGDAADQGNDFVIRDPDGDDQTLKISRRHLEIRRESSRYAIVDLSTTGTSVNGERLAKGQPRPLAAGDIIEVANVMQLEVLLPLTALSGPSQSQVNLPPRAGGASLVAEASIGDMITDESADA